MHRTAGRYLRAMTVGVLSVGVGLVAGELIAALAVAPASPVGVVGAQLIDHTPSAIREWAIDTFGTSDKTALLSGIAAAVVVLAAIAGILQFRRPPTGAAVIGAFGLVGAACAVTRPTGTALYAVPSLCAGVIGIVVLVVLSRRAIGSRRGPEPEPPEPEHPVPEDAQPVATVGWSRRRFVAVSGGIAVLIAASGYAARRIAATGGAVAERMGLRLPAVRDVAAPITPSMGVQLPGATPFLTSAADFYRIDTALAVPQLTTRQWRLRIHGMVARELTLDWEDLMAMPARERVVTLTCVSNEVGGDLAGNARWLGYPMAEILARVGAEADADMLLSTSVDGWTSGTPLSAITDGRDAMLVIGMNGAPLPLEHGYPVRQVIPGLYGFVSACKWVIDWEITRFDRAQSYWTKRGWGEKAPIKTASRIDRPAPFASLPVGPVVVAGTAWAQHRGVRSVQVRVDDGPWQEATLAPEYSIDTWRQWTWTWDAQPGQHTLYCRATDATGATQPDTRVPPIPDGATGWHSRVMTVQR
ncbi:molybdopterin-dependent oxidoreductase [Gordonia polyisoprenivorans]|uniref:molybdopterin-dependent oxidoreductase n=1 Tax=Gordonia polyisoprenivorans TaxID=84595 RepID=UPI001B8D3A1E|nr:molybdopterin-dependent oxidoreductase [Gordonia polyisoprenivorans]QUD84500.1 molybdopterin-dependent oxidoreductase [Gordonia polyisoprenivorans]